MGFLISVVLLWFGIRCGLSFNLIVYLFLKSCILVYGRTVPCCQLVLPDAGLHLIDVTWNRVG